MDVLVTGASSLVATYLVPRLRAQGRNVILTSRTRPAYLGADSRVRWLQRDLVQSDVAADQTVPADVLIHLAPLPLLRRAVVVAAGAKRVIAFGTTSRFTKADSPVAAERRMVAEQTEIEAWLAAGGAQGDLHWTLFRPTMVYDGLRDKNVALIARFVRRFGFFPLVGEAGGIRQPVHAADLALACCLALENETAFCKAYNLGGGETLSYRDMVERIFISLGKKPRFVSIPPPLLKATLEIGRHLPRYSYLNASMADRMNKDMVFDWSEAAHDFGYNPRKFAGVSGYSRTQGT